jgi:hypothetical protein
MQLASLVCSSNLARLLSLTIQSLFCCSPINKLSTCAQKGRPGAAARRRVVGAHRTRPAARGGSAEGDRALSGRLDGGERREQPAAGASPPAAIPRRATRKSCFVLVSLSLDLHVRRASACCKSTVAGQRGTVVVSDCKAPCGTPCRPRPHGRRVGCACLSRPASGRACVSATRSMTRMKCCATCVLCARGGA